MRNRMYGGVRGRKTKVGRNYFVFLLLDDYIYKLKGQRIVDELNPLGAGLGVDALEESFCCFIWLLFFFAANVQKFLEMKEKLKIAPLTIFCIIVVLLFYK